VTARSPVQPALAGRAARGAAAVCSARLFQAPQVVHWPAHWANSAPHSAQRY
jgi:hypothetical protein